MSPKNIVLLIDGTWNVPLGPDHMENTNVSKLDQVLPQSVPTQIKNYIKGVGTGVIDIPWPPPRRHMTTTSPNRLDRWLGGSCGLGVAKRIREMYAYLSSNYAPKDRIYIFGFSRGAFIARSLAGFVDSVGLLLKDRIDLVEQAYDLYEKGPFKDGVPPDHLLAPLRDFLYRIADSERPSDGQVLPIYFIGVWDTVGALGIPIRKLSLNAYFTEHHQTELPSNVTHARHALALHEMRRHYEPLLWLQRHPNNPGQSLKQVWFNGAHADVGGGYSETGLSDIALDWMIKEAKAVGLLVSSKAAPASQLVVHHEMRRLFRHQAPAIREALSERAKLAKDTLETFKLHHSTNSTPSLAGYWPQSTIQKFSDITVLIQDFEKELRSRGVHFE